MVLFSYLTNTNAFFLSTQSEHGWFIHSFSESLKISKLFSTVNKVGNGSEFLSHGKEKVRIE